MKIEHLFYDHHMRICSKSCLRLPVLRHGVPDADLSSGREGDELRPDEEEAVHHGPKVEGANVHAHPVLQYQCTLYGYGRDLSNVSNKEHHHNLMD